jgi:hypothetical protein
MKFIYIFFALMLRLSITYAQDKILFVYADASTNLSQFSIRNKLFNAVQDSEHKLILYISNGKSPLVSSNIYETQLLVDKISKLSIPEPNIVFDLDSINKLFCADSILSEVSLRASDIKENFVFYFFFNAAQCRLKKQDVRIARALLLSNRLMTKNRLLSSCRAKLYIQNISTAADSVYFRKIQEEGVFEVEAY